MGSLRTRSPLPFAFAAVTACVALAPDPPHVAAPADATLRAAGGAHEGLGNVVPAASSAPASSASSAAPPRSPFAYANVDPDDDGVVGPPDVRASCAADLKAAGIAYQAATLAIHVQPKSKITCGAPQVITYRGSPAKIAYQPSVLVTCTMALALARFEQQVQEEAQRAFGKRVVKIHHLGTYNCREMVAYPGWVSEHSYANAIDIADFMLEDGRTIDVLKHFAPKLKEPKTPSSSFLREVASRAYREETFSSVLSPFFNAQHANHFHLDMARFRSDGTYYGVEAP